MNVLKELLNVMIFVTIPLAVILATVLDLVIDFTVMVSPAKVHTIMTLSIAINIYLEFELLIQNFINNMQILMNVLKV